MHYSTLIRPACSCEQRRDEDSTRTLAPGSYKTPEKSQACKEKGIDICKSPDPLHPKNESFLLRVYASLTLTLKGKPENKAQRKKTSVKRNQRNISYPAARPVSSLRSIINSEQSAQRKALHCLLSGRREKLKNRGVPDGLSGKKNDYRVNLLVS